MVPDSKVAWQGRRTKKVPFSENSPRAGIRCQRLEANPEDDISNAVQALHGVVVVEVNASSANASTLR